MVTMPPRHLRQNNNGRPSIWHTTKCRHSCNFGDGDGDGDGDGGDGDGDGGDGDGAVLYTAPSYPVVGPSSQGVKKFLENVTELEGNLMPS